MSKYCVELIRENWSYQFNLSGVDYVAKVKFKTFDEEGCNATLDYFLTVSRIEKRKLFNLIPYDKRVYLGKYTFYYRSNGWDTFENGNKCDFTVKGVKYYRSDTIIKYARNVIFNIGGNNN